MKFAIFDVARCRMSATSLTFLSSFSFLFLKLKITIHFRPIQYESARGVEALWEGCGSAHQGRPVIHPAAIPSPQATQEV